MTPKTSSKTSRITLGRGRCHFSAIPTCWQFQQFLTGKAFTLIFCRSLQKSLPERRRKTGYNEASQVLTKVKQVSDEGARWTIQAAMKLKLSRRGAYPFRTRTS